MTAVAEEKKAPVARELPRLKQKYRAEIKTAMQNEFGYANPMQVPGLVKSSW